MAELKEPLSDRELDVLAQVVQGAANKEIAEKLVISPNTVKVHLRNIFTKLNVSSRTEASIAAVELGLVTLAGDIPVDGAAAAPLDPAGAVDGAAAAPEPARPASHHLWPAVAVVALLVAVTTLAWPWLTGQGVVVAPESTAVPFADIQIADTRWFETLPMNEGRLGMALVATGSNLVRIGGETPAGVPTGEVAVYDTVAKTWQPGAEKPTPVTEAGGASLFGEIYVVGGRLADGRPTARAESYSPAQDAWRALAALPRPLWGGLVLSEGGYLYHFGGTDGATVFADSYVYDPSANGWRALPPLPDPRAYATGGVLEGKLYIVGGTDGRALQKSCLFFDPELESWGSCAPLAEARGQAGAAVVLNKLYVIGGDTAANYGELYDPKTDVWQIINMPMLDEGNRGDAGWPLLGVANVEARIYVLGGRLDGEQPSAAAFVYAPLVYQSFIPVAPGTGPLESTP